MIRLVCRGKEMMVMELDENDPGIMKIQSSQSLHVEEHETNDGRKRMGVFGFI